MIKSPAFVVFEEKLRRNLEKIKSVASDAGVDIIMALKANALWKTFPIISEYVSGAAASSLNEMRLARAFLGGAVHVYCPVYTDDTFPEFLKGASHIIFNSIFQFEKFFPVAKDYEKNTGRHISLGLRVNPKCSVIEHDIYNPAVAGSRFGMSNKKLPPILPEGIEGLHFHSLCESGARELDMVLSKFEQDFGKYFPRLKWVNFGGGHLITKEDYDTNLFVSTIKAFKKRYPHLKIILEPGSAFTWQTGDLYVTVLDIVEDEGIHTAIIDASFACHMPDCLEMPYKPVIEEALPDDLKIGFEYRLGGNTCLTGDFVGTWKFAQPLRPGDRLTLKDMNHYTTVKTNMFNGVQHPSIWLVPIEGEPRLLRAFNFNDYRDRMD